MPAIQPRNWGLSITFTRTRAVFAVRIHRNMPFELSPKWSYSGFIIFCSLT